MATKENFKSVEGGVYLPTDKLLQDIHQPRQNFADEDIESLGESISSRKQKQAVIVSPAKDKPGFYYIKYGESRWRACKKKGIKQILCIIDHDDAYDGKLNPLRVLDQAVENQIRKGHTHSELVRVIGLLIEYEKGVQERGAITRAEETFAHAMGRSKIWAENYKTLCNLHKDLLPLVDSKGGGLPFMTAVQLARNDQGVQKLILEEAKKKNKSGQMSNLHRLVGNLSKRHSEKSGKKVRVRASESRAAYFSFFKKIVNMMDNLVGHLTPEEFKKFEEDCLSFGLGDNAKAVLPQAKEILRFFEERVKALEKSVSKKK